MHNLLSPFAPRRAPRLTKLPVIRTIAKNLFRVADALCSRSPTPKKRCKRRLRQQSVSLSPNGATHTYPFPVAHMSDKWPIFSKSRRFFRFWLMAKWPRGRDARHGLDFEMEIRFVTMILWLFNDSMLYADWRLSMPKCELANWLFVIFESWQGDIGVSDRTEL